MARFALQRVLQSILVVFGVLVIVFLMVHLIPGDPAQALFGDAPVPKAQVEEVRHALGLDQPLDVQFARFLERVLRGDFGRSLKTDRPVASDLARAIPSTAELAVGAMMLALVGGTCFGIVSASRHNTWFDGGVSTLALLGISFPTFWTGLLLIWLFSVKLDWFPITGQHSLRTLVLPAVTLGWYAGAILARLVRSGMLEVLGQDYVRTAWAKGLPKHRILAWHALRNALIPVITVAGVQFGTLLGGAVVVETVFGRDGVGRMLVLAILQKDFPEVQGAVFVLATAYSLTNLAADLFYGFIDPRVRYW
jgi:peptide/nickel transport system permease protein/oligopeptide transport system permease protein